MLLNQARKISPQKRLNRLIRFIFGLTCLFFISASSFAQSNDSLIKGDTIAIKKTVYHSPKKAALMSAVLPGLGQAYNKKYWKIPVIYAGFAGLGYAINFNQVKYVRYRNALRTRLDSDPATVDNYVGQYSDDQLNTLQQYYHRYRDLSVIGAVLIYVLNIVDASV
ncbi:MAG: DUF5683 domain-containing protein, partial [Bacteroidota bacterium]|nr:DUF5683 domain-containing protein [Bacteroidota bacterium]